MRTTHRTDNPGPAAPPPPPCFARGFTLVETIATIVVIAIVAGMASRLISEGSREYSDAAVRSLLNKQLSTALDRLVTEFRQIGQDTSSGTAPDISSSFAATSMTWNTLTSSRTVSFNSGTGIVQLSGAAAANSTLLSGCTAFTLAYADKDNATVSPGGSAPSIRRITITITVAQGSITETLRSKVYIRSMMIGSNAS